MAIYKTLKLSSLYPHPVITQSVNDSLNVYGNDSFNELSDAMLEVLQQAHPVHVVPAGSDKTYHFFAGWQLFHELRRRGRSNVYAVIHTTPPPNLEEWAVMAELVLSSPAVAKARHPESAFPLLSRSRGLWGKVFSGTSPRTPVKALERLCGISRSAAQRIAAPETPDHEPSMLQELLGMNPKREQQ